MIVMCVCQHEVSVNDNADQFMIDIAKNNLCPKCAATDAAASVNGLPINTPFIFIKVIHEAYGARATSRGIGRAINPCTSAPFQRLFFATFSRIFK